MNHPVYHLGASYARDAVVSAISTRDHRAADADLHLRFWEFKKDEGLPMDVGSPSIPSATGLLNPHRMASLAATQVSNNPCHRAGQRPWNFRGDGLRT